MKKCKTNLDKPTAKEICLFLSDYGATMLACGATCIRLERNMSRIAEAFNMKVDFSIMPRHLQMTVKDLCDETMFTYVSAVPSRPISFNVNTRLSRLSWAIADRKISFIEMERLYRLILAEDHPLPYLPLLVGAANASFCRLFGGDWVAMACVFIATVAGFYLKQQLTARKMDYRFITFICAFVSTVLGATDALFALGSTPALSVGTSVLYLVPGIPFLNSFSDMLYRHYICALSRFIDAAVITACLSAGLCAGMLLMHLGMF